MVTDSEQAPLDVAMLKPVVTRDDLSTKTYLAESTATKEDDNHSERSSSRSRSDAGLMYEDRIAKAETLDLLADEYPLPSLQGPRWYNRLRYHYLSMYVRLHIIVLLANIGALLPMAIGSQRSKPEFTYQDASTAFAANMFVIFLTRNEHFINTLFHVFREFT